MSVTDARPRTNLAVIASFLIIVAVAILPLAGYLFVALQDVQRIQRGFDRVQIGDSLNVVISELGQPTTIIEHQSPDPSATTIGIVDAKTAVEYRYKSTWGWMPHFWSIQIDHQQRVVFKRQS